jgi:hypothetical protein
VEAGAPALATLNLRLPSARIMEVSLGYFQSTYTISNQLVGTGRGCYGDVICDLEKDSFAFSQVGMVFFDAYLV